MDKIIKILKENKRFFIAIGVFLLVSSVYFSPVFDGYTLKQDDIKGHIGMAKELRDYYAENGENTLWTNSMFGGMPGYLISTRYKTLTTPTDSVLGLFLPHPIFVLFLSMLCFFIMGRAMKINDWLSIIGAIAYGLISYNMIALHAGHNTKVHALAYMPAVIGAFIMIFQNKKILFPTALFALFLALNLMANHIQMTYYMAFILIFIGVAQGIRYLINNDLSGFFKRTGLIIIAAIFALCSNFANYYFVYSYGKKSIRGASELTLNDTKNEAIDSKIAQAEEENCNPSSGLDRDYIVNWSYGKQETLNLLIPNAKGQNNLANDFVEKLRKDNKIQLYNFAVQNRMYAGYWGNQPFTVGPNYIGAIMVFLALLYLIFVQTPLKWALFGVSFLAILLSWGDNLGGGICDMWLTNFFIDYIPLYSKFRAVSSILTIVNFTVPLMAILYLNHLISNKDWSAKRKKNFLIASGSILGVLVLMYLAPGFLDFISDKESLQFNSLSQAYLSNPQSVNPSIFKSELIDFRIGAFRDDLLRTILLILFSGVAIYLLAIQKIKAKVLIPIIGLLAVFDVWNVDTRYLNSEKDKTGKYLYWKKADGYQNAEEATNADIGIYQAEVARNSKITQLVNEELSLLRSKQKGKISKQDQESVMFSVLNLNSNYRVLDLEQSFNKSRASYFHKSTGGYHPAKLRRYQDVIDMYLRNELQLLNKNDIQNMKMFNMLNNKYYIYPDQSGDYQYFQNPFVYGNAWFVDEVEIVGNPNEEIKKIGEVDTKKVAVVNKKYADYVSGLANSADSSATITMNSYAPNKITYTSNSSSDKLAVFSEIYFEDGWIAKIGGEEVPHINVNYILRGLKIPKGTQEIEFEFKPTMFTVGNMINIISFLSILLVLGFFTWKNIKSTPLIEDEK